MRAALSISSNIAEACGRGTVADFRRVLVIARGSAQEVLSQLRVARRMDPQRAKTIDPLISRAALILKMIARLHSNPPPDR